MHINKIHFSIVSNCVRILEIYFGFQLWLAYILLVSGDSTVISHLYNLQSDHPGRPRTRPPPCRAVTVSVTVFLKLTLWPVVVHQGRTEASIISSLTLSYPSLSLSQLLITPNLKNSQPRFNYPVLHVQLWFLLCQTTCPTGH